MYTMNMNAEDEKIALMMVELRELRVMQVL